MNRVAAMCNLATTCTKYEGQEHVELYGHSAIPFHYEVYNPIQKAKLLAATGKLEVVPLLHCAEECGCPKLQNFLLVLQRHNTVQLYTDVSEEYAATIIRLSELY
jgi:hypothetical protein